MQGRLLWGVVIWVAVGGADETDGIGPVGLDFEMQAPGGLHCGHNMQVILFTVKYISSLCMATYEINNSHLTGCV